MIDPGTIANWFTYHPPTPDQQQAYETIRAHAREFANVLNQFVPDGADKSAAFRQLRETVMTANAAIACHTEVSPPSSADLEAKLGSQVIPTAPNHQTVFTPQAAPGGGSTATPVSMESLTDKYLKEHGLV